MRAIGLAMIGATALLAGESGRFAPPTGPAADAETALAAGLAKAESFETSSDQKVDVLAAAVARAVERLEPHSPAFDQLQSLLGDTGHESMAQRYEKLKRTAANVAGELAFTPKFEANMPAGFPTYTPVGAIEVKKYPEYRMASGENFWTLFQHIQQNQIEMTAPVQMSFTSGDEGEMKQSEMSFLYGQRKIGSPGVHGNVNVLDAEAHTVVSLGMRGPRSKETLLDARNRLRKWIKHNSTYEAAGTMRVMGYNSPAVPRDRQFFEVQIPLKRLKTTASASDPT